MRVIIEGESQRRRFHKKCKVLGIIIAHEVLKEFPYEEMIITTGFGKYAIPLKTGEDVVLGTDSQKIITVKMLEKINEKEFIAL